jgi:hypothetical protein
MPDPRKKAPLTERIDELKTSAPAPDSDDDTPDDFRDAGGPGLGGATAGTPAGPAATTAKEAGTPARAAHVDEADDPPPA